MPIAAFLVYAGPLVDLFYTDRYADATDAAKLLVVGQGIHFLTLLAFTTLVAVSRNRLYPIAMLLGVVVNVGLNILLIPEYCYVGSGWATVITEVLVLAVLTFGVYRIPADLPFPARPIAKCVGAGVLAAAVGWASLGRIPWPIGGALTVIVYLGTVHLLAVNGPGGLRGARRCTTRRPRGGHRRRPRPSRARHGNARLATPKGEITLAWHDRAL